MCARFVPRKGMDQLYDQTKRRIVTVVMRYMIRIVPVRKAVCLVDSLVDCLVALMVLLSVLLSVLRP